MTEQESLSELRSQISANVDFVDIKPFTHNIISVVLRIIAEDYGVEAANKTIRDFHLDQLGWTEQ